MNGDLKHRKETYAEDMYDVIGELGDAIADMFEQMINGNWIDDHGHDLVLNQQMISLQRPIQKAIDLRKKINGA